jgi:hypothetical protein
MAPGNYLQVLIMKRSTSINSAMASFSSSPPEKSGRSESAVEMIYGEDTQENENNQQNGDLEV